MWKILFFTGMYISTHLSLFGQSQNCNTNGPQNNPVLTFDDKKLVFNGLGGSSGFVVMNQSVTIPTHLAANGIYDENGEIVFVVTYEPVENSNSFSHLVGFNKFGQKFYLYRKSAFGFNSSDLGTDFSGLPAIGLSNFGISNKLIIFQAPGKCDEYYIIHASEFFDRNGTGVHSTLTKIKFSTNDHSMHQLTSAIISDKFGKSVDLVSALLKDANQGSPANPNPNYNKMYRNIYSFGIYESGNGGHNGFITTFKVYEGVDYFESVLLSFPLVQLPGGANKPTVYSFSCSTPNYYCPGFYIDDATIISQTDQSSKLLLVGNRGMIMAGGIAPIDNYTSPIWLFEEKYNNGVLTYHLSACSTDIAKISGIAIKDGNILDGTIDYVFYSQERGTEKNIRVNKNVELASFEVGNPLHSQPAFLGSIGPPASSGSISNSNNTGENSALEISYGEKYLIFPIVPVSGTPSLGLMELSSIATTSDITTDNMVYTVPQITSFYTDLSGQHATNTQLYRQQYAGTENNQMPTCEVSLLVNNQTTSSGIGPQANVSDWIQAQGSSLVEANKRAHFIAGNYVQLKPSFHAEANSDFRAAIQSCPYASRCCQAAIPVNIIYTMGVGGRMAVSKTNGKLDQPISIFPNPAHQYFGIVLPDGVQLEKLEMRDITQRKIQSWAPNPDKKYSIAGLSSGIYFITIETNKNVETHKLVVE
jgi:hypothetical protein